MLFKTAGKTLCVSFVVWTRTFTTFVWFRFARQAATFCSIDWLRSSALAARQQERLIKNKKGALAAVGRAAQAYALKFAAKLLIGGVNPSGT